MLSGEYDTTPAAVSAIESGLRGFYQTGYPDVYSQKQDSIIAAVTELQRIFQTYNFPEMKTNWRSHPNNAGHMNSAGCFRCHDGEHFSSSGKMIRNDCNLCHTTLYDSAARPEMNMQIGSFIHPVDLGGLANRQCSSCHQPDRPFVHPINLGDISRFQCAECHPR